METLPTVLLAEICKFWHPFKENEPLYYGNIFSVSKRVSAQFRMVDQTKLGYSLQLTASSTKIHRFFAENKAFLHANLVFTSDFNHYLSGYASTIQKTLLRSYEQSLVNVKHIFNLNYANFHYWISDLLDRYNIVVHLNLGSNDVYAKLAPVNRQSLLHFMRKYPKKLSIWLYCITYMYGVDSFYADFLRESWLNNPSLLTDVIWQEILQQDTHLVGNSILHHIRPPYTHFMGIRLVDLFEELLKDEKWQRTVSRNTIFVDFIDQVITNEHIFLDVLKSHRNLKNIFNLFSSPTHKFIKAFWLQINKTNRVLEIISNTLALCENSLDFYNNFIRHYLTSGCCGNCKKFFIPWNFSSDYYLSKLNNKVCCEWKFFIKQIEEYFIDNAAFTIKWKIKPNPIKITRCFDFIQDNFLNDPQIKAITIKLFVYYFCTQLAQNRVWLFDLFKEIFCHLVWSYKNLFKQMENFENKKEDEINDTLNALLRYVVVALNLHEKSEEKTQENVIKNTKYLLQLLDSTWTINILKLVKVTPLWLKKYYTKQSKRKKIKLEDVTENSKKRVIKSSWF